MKKRMPRCPTARILFLLPVREGGAAARGTLTPTHAVPLMFIVISLTEMGKVGVNHSRRSLIFFTCASSGVIYSVR